jgi:hypothetical protein
MVTLTDAELIDAAKRAGLCLAECWALEPGTEDPYAREKLSALRAFVEIVSVSCLHDGLQHMLKSLEEAMQNPHGHGEQEAA